ncbi:beta-N-acetylhexosaminidase [Litoreibacter arenae]|uniref:beta-N-acetylhexosaminidase n=1 Tax=Litoreibacter arenae DSM 19593 TaxID=1123360 RepID=S9QNX3_9RHOB|nr:beta-N-acetylhexosaminidase [Litoreibacter arenae]EPX81313.1 Beta N-acetyl-glucosaminidase [Litoreibacter arenae DSM 19593]
MLSGAYIFGCEGLRLSEAEHRFFASAQPWGFILFARNIENREQLSALTDELRSAVGWNAPILIDQEGGRVQRMRAPEWREYPPALDQMEMAGDNAARAMYLRNRLIAAELSEVGIDVNCAPLADVIWPESHPVLRNRCYGSDVDTVVEMCLATEQGLLDGGVLPVLKHIPGYGRAVVDGHKDLPRVDVPRAELDALDFAPFKRLTHMAMGMTAHIVFPCIDDLPATTSAKAMKMIREEIGFDNLIMTDDISMEALSGTVAERARASLGAGCDIALHCNGRMSEMVAVADASGPMRLQSQTRATRALSQRRTPTDIDISALEAEFRTLVAG